MNKLTQLQKRPLLDTRRGSALIAIIAAILIFSVLAASLIPLISTSSRQAAISALSDKAYLLAESGYRLLESRYRNAGPTESDQNAALEDLDDGNFTLADDEGQFHLRVYSYFYEITGDANATSTQITANPPGSLPVDDTLDGDEVQVSTGASLLSIDGLLYTINNASPATFTQDGNITFTVDPLVNAVQDGTVAYPAARVRNAVGSLQTGGTLPYYSGEGALFPLRNGRFILDGSIVLDYRYNNRTSNQFEGVSDPNQASMGFPVAAGASMVLTNYARVHSLGIVGGATAGTDREVIYYSALPLSASSAPTRTMEDNFDDTDTVPDNWDVTAPGTTGVDIAEVDGNQAMRITRADDDSSLVELKSSVTEDIFNAYRRSTGGYMSYDAQVKVGFSPLPDSPYLIPAYVAAGLSFRLNTVTSNSNYNGYGLSFLRGYSGMGDRIPNDIVPINDQPLIVLWYQSDVGANRQWIAYKNLQSLFYEENFDSGTLNGWTRVPEASENLWYLYSGFGYPSQPALRFGPITDTIQNGSIQSPDIVLACSDSAEISLTFRSWEDFKDSDVQTVSIYDVDDGTRTSLIFNKISDGSPFRLASADLTSFGGRTIRIEFYFDKNHSDSFDWGWVIDDIKIICQWPVHDSTLAVRLQEAAKVSFDQGGTDPFEKGDRVYGQTSGAMGTVISPPLLSGDDWAGMNAVGTLLLNNISTSTQFQPNERIVTIGHGSRSARVYGYNVATDSQANIIRAYYAGETGNPPGNSDLLDAHTLAYPRRNTGEGLEWFPEEGGNWTAAQDYFRLIQWDAVNSGNVANLDSIPDLFGGAIAIDNVILNHHDDYLQTPPISSSARPS